MAGLTAEQRKTLDGLVQEYGVSLDRSEDEKLRRKAMEDKARILEIDPRHFKALATAIWKGRGRRVHEDLSAQLDLFALFDDEGWAARSAQWPKDSGAKVGRAERGALQ